MNKGLMPGKNMTKLLHSITFKRQYNNQTK